MFKKKPKSSFFGQNPVQDSLETRVLSSAHSAYTGFLMSVPDLPLGVILTALDMHRDPRGDFTEIYRQSWPTGVVPVQWNVVSSRPNVLRGVHLHLRHWDYMLALSGRILVNLIDLRPDSPTKGLHCALEFTEEKIHAVTIPPGVLHGFYYFAPSVHIYAVSEYWDVADELGCRYDDPALGLSWPNADPILSPRDAALGKFSALQAMIPDGLGGARASPKAASGRRDFEIAR
jgi:dTDP-4-dehydrorhamnose 3,5-epimerase